jgi:hypothetical protein
MTMRERDETVTALIRDLARSTIDAASRDASCENRKLPKAVKITKSRNVFFFMI